jgi:protease-4
MGSYALRILRADRRSHLDDRALLSIVAADFAAYNTYMKTIMLALTFLGLILSGGCGGNTGFIIKPVPVNEQLEETVRLRDPGLIVSDKIVVIDVSGMIMNTHSGLMGMGENPVSLFVEMMDKAQADPDVKGVVLVVNSPGGGVTASDIMYQRLLQFKAAKKVPVVASIQDVGASGAYFISCGADRIMATRNSITGSIGVIVQLFSFAGTMEKMGIESKAITSGRFKDMASPFKPVNKEDDVLLQGIVNTYYEQFLGVVVKGRPKLTPERVRELADGRVYTGQDALANGLVDELGYVEDAEKEVKTLSGCKRVKIVIYHRPLGYRANEYATAGSLAAGASKVDINVNLPNMMALVQPQFLALWTGATPRK